MSSQSVLNTHKNVQGSQTLSERHPGVLPGNQERIRSFLNIQWKDYQSSETALRLMARAI